MLSRRRRSSIELEVQGSAPAASPSVNALQASHSNSNTELGVVARVEQQLEAADGGAAAWRILCAAFMFEAVLFGKDHVGPHPTRLVDGNVDLPA